MVELNKDTTDEGQADQDPRRSSRRSDAQAQHHYESRGELLLPFRIQGPKPAAFVMSMQARTVMFMLIAGMYEWIPEGRKKNKSPWEKKTDEWKRRQKQNGQP